MNRIKISPVWIILTLALLLRLPLLNSSFWLDEAAQALESVRPWSQQLRIAADFQPPLIHLLVHGLMKISIAEWWLRWWVATLPGLGMVSITYWLGRQLFNKQVGWWAALLVATNSFHIFYSQELRPYALTGFWVCLSW